MNRFAEGGFNANDIYKLQEVLQMVSVFKVGRG